MTYRYGRTPMSLILPLMAALGFVLAGGTILLARLELGLAPVWPLHGVLFAIALASASGRRVAVVIAGLAGAACANFVLGDAPLVILGFGLGNGLLVTIAILTLSDLRRPGLGRPRPTLLAARLAAAALGGPALCAMVHATALGYARNAPFLQTWEVSFAASALGLALTAPFLLLRRHSPTVGRETPVRRAGLLTALVAVLVVTLLAFSQPDLPLGFLTLTVQAQPALLGGVFGALASQVVVTLVSVLLTSLGQGYVDSLLDSPVKRVQFLQFQLAGSGLAVIGLGLLVERHRRVTARLRLAHRRALAEAAGGRAFHRMVEERVRAPLLTASHETPEKLAEALSEALSAAEQVRAFTGLRHGAKPPGIGPVEVAPVIRSVFEELAPLAADRRVTLRSEGAALPRASAEALHAILLALVRNGISYRRVDGGMVAIRAAEARGLARILVEDDGIGIAPALVPRLFRPFDRLGLDQHPLPGLGLGLSHARRLAQALGGTLEYEPHDGATCFVLILPAAMAEAEVS